ncbi:unnamed protein product [Parascedosporium putredinis]|uniref:Uncharacterized protein n=1 Tax=Parascedosporium putredinis TaxID=1442378 RepID=A0A9P1MB67_9PEZI|nr:unnamed protein product [Parascedosporium putredinis]CAI7994051.1 unnamed protein product [Parascedosporium putredinis]
MLKPQIAWLNNARAMCALFPLEYQKAGADIPRAYRPIRARLSNQRDELEGYLVDKFGLRSKAPLYRSSPPDLRSWMNLDGTFWWLEAPNGSSSDRKGFSSVAEDWQIDVVIAQAKALGLTLPVGYETFMRSRHLSYRIPSYNGWYYELGKLVPCPPEIDNGAGGYIQVFHFDQQCCAFAYLYLNKAGNHCVLYSHRELYDDNFDFDDPVVAATDVDEDTLKRKENVDYSGTNADYNIVGLSFEEYLVGVYFEEQLNFANDLFPCCKTTSPTSTTLLQRLNVCVTRARRLILFSIQSSGLLRRRAEMQRTLLHLDCPSTIVQARGRRASIHG